jgi:hypothetical protein
MTLFSPAVLLAVLAVTCSMTYVISRLGHAPRRAAVPWLCGYAQEAECHRYVARQFYGEIKRYFHWLGGAPTPAAASSGAGGSAQPVKDAAWKDR